MKILRMLAISVLLPTLSISGDNTSMIQLKEILSLPVSAASGLLYVDEYFYTVSDDELDLFKISKSHSIEKFKLLDGKLPEENPERKKKKPDFESLFMKDAKIVAMPSMSKPNRIKAVSFDVTSKKTSVMDLTGLHQKASSIVDELNIEGSIITSNELWLFQRGNGLKGKNGILKLDASSLEINSFQKIDLGKMKEHTLGFTDAVVSGDFIYFLAVVESAKSTYDDGKYLGAILGKMNLSGKVLNTIEVNSPYKPEGLALDGDIIYIVTDADDRKIPSKLYMAKLPENF